jgi:hypothetical protein
VRNAAWASAAGSQNPLTPVDDHSHRLIDIATHVESFRDRDEIMRALEEIELVHDALAPEQRDLPNQLIERLMGVPRAAAERLLRNDWSLRQGNDP